MELSENDLVMGSSGRFGKRPSFLNSMVDPAILPWASALPRALARGQIEHFLASAEI